MSVLKYPNKEVLLEALTSSPKQEAIYFNGEHWYSMTPSTLAQYETLMSNMLEILNYGKLQNKVRKQQSGVRSS